MIFAAPSPSPTFEPQVYSAQLDRLVDFVIAAGCMGILLLAILVGLKLGAKR